VTDKAELYRELAPLLDSPKRGMDGRVWSYCPVHGDGAKHRGQPGQAGRSLSLHPKLGLDCFAGCEFTDIVKALKKKEVQPVQRVSSRKSAPAPATETLVKVFKYQGADGEVIAEKGRFERPDGTKTFKWRLPGSDKWGGLGFSQSELPLYGSYGLSAVDMDTPVLFVEGEKSAEACWQNGLIAVSGCGGAGQKDFGRSLDVLRGRDVWLWPDNDTPGRALMAHLRTLLRPICRALRTVQVSLPEKGDAFDYFASGGTVEGLGLTKDDEEQHASLTLTDEGKVIQRVPLPSRNLVVLTGESVRKEKTGVHARVGIALNSTEIAWTSFNVERDEDRLRLANSAYKRLNGVSDEITALELKGYLDTFCARLWPATLDATMPEDLHGAEYPLPVEFLLEPFIVGGGGTILFGPPGRGKSWTLLLMAISMDAGVDVLWPVTQCPVLFINLERSRSSIQQRIGRVNQALGLPRTRPLLTINARGKSLSDVIDSARQAVRAHGVRCVFLDSISRAGFGDLNENRPVNAIIDALNGLSESWLGLAHTPRADATHAYGSVHFDAGADVMVQLTSQQDAHSGAPLGIGLQVTKQNDFAKAMGRLQIVALDFDEEGLTHVRRSDEGEFPEIGELAAEKTSLEQAVREFLLRNGTATANQVADGTGYSRETVSKYLNGNLREFYTAKNDRDKRQVLYGMRARDV